MGIEPTSKAWEAFILPLNYTRIRGEIHRLRIETQVVLHAVESLVSIRIIALSNNNDTHF